MKILLTGSNGQLGHDFQKLFDNLNIKYIATDYQDLDIADSKNLKKFFDKNNDFTHIINCAAYNDVDKAQNDDKVFLLNEQAPKKLAELSKKLGAIFITYSTDFVFDGKKGKNYTEDDIPTPLSNYGLSKANGEKLTLNAYEKSFVIRTSWVFGKANNNFNTQVINWSKTRNELNI
ncbi:NAD(P)-dependent oxidoreductase, partial [Leptotrichia trevisanii]|uniref:SDR family oxidoreductase n=1 Tax=Leptotrichia trevisanii TaxID=109328 RepID=UPI0026EFD546